MAKPLEQGRVLEFSDVRFVDAFGFVGGKNFAGDLLAVDQERHAFDGTIAWERENENGLDGLAALVDKSLRDASLGDLVADRNIDIKILYMISDVRFDGPGPWPRQMKRSRMVMRDDEALSRCQRRPLDQKQKCEQKTAPFHWKTPGRSNGPIDVSSRWFQPAEKFTAEHTREESRERNFDGGLLVKVPASCKEVLCHKAVTNRSAVSLTSDDFCWRCAGFV